METIFWYVITPYTRENPDRQSSSDSGKVQNKEKEMYHVIL